MLLKELAEASGTSVASIKYYRREGLLPPGRRITATQQHYDRSHVERLQLIQVLRELVDLPIVRIHVVTQILDDPEQPLLMALGSVQDAILGLDSPAEVAGPATEHPSIAPMLRALGWPDVSSAPRRALHELLVQMDQWGAPTEADALLRFGRSMSELATADLAWMRTTLPEDGSPRVGPEPSATAPRQPLDEPPEQPSDEPAEKPSDDVMVLRATVGIVAYDRLIRVLRALAHASWSMADVPPGTVPGMADAAGPSAPGSVPPRETPGPAQ